MWPRTPIWQRGLSQKQFVVGSTPTGAMMKFILFKIHLMEEELEAFQELWSQVEPHTDAEYRVDEFVLDGIKDSLLELGE